MENKIICSREERLIKFAEIYPEAALEFISMGEPISIKFLREMATINSEFVDKVFSIGFLVKYNFNPYSSGRMEIDDSQQIYEFMKCRYGKKIAEDMVITSDVLWLNFMPFAAKKLNEDGRLADKFKWFIKNKDYEKAQKLLIYLPEKYLLKVQTSISKDELLLFIEWSIQNGRFKHFNYVIKAVDYLVKNNVISPAIVDVYFCHNDYSDKAIKKILRREKGLEMIKATNNEFLIRNMERIIAKE